MGRLTRQPQHPACTVTSTQFFALVIVLALPFATLLARMTFRHTERMAELKGGGTSDPTVHARLDRIERSVESIAVETERIGEGQRFLTRVAADRALPAGGVPLGSAGHA